MLLKLKKYFAGRGVGYYMTLPAIICMAAAYNLYCKNGITQFQPSLNSTAIICCWVAFGIGALSLVFDCKYIRFVAYLVALYSFMMFINSQVTYIANVFVSIDGNSFSGGFIATMVTFLLGAVLLIVSGCLTDWHPWVKEA